MSGEYTIGNWGKIGSQSSGTNPDFYTYQDSSYTLAEIITGGFFEGIPSDIDIIEGSQIIVKGSDSSSTYVISTVTSTDITLGAEDGLFNEAGGFVSPETSTNSMNVATGESYFINEVDINTGGTLDNVAYLDTAQTFTALQTGLAPVADLNFATKKYVDDNIITAEVSVSSAELLALAASPKTLIAAPGADKYIQFLGASIVLDFGTAAYVEGTYNAAIRYTDGSGVIVSKEIETTGFLDQTADTITSVVPVKDAIVAAADAVNQAVVFDNIGGGEWTTGDGTLTITIQYKVVTAGL